MTPDQSAPGAHQRRRRKPTAKPGEIKIVYGRVDGSDDVCAVWGGEGADKCDARFVMNALDQKRMGHAFPSMETEYRPSVIEELEARGYDITTLRFSITRTKDQAS